MKNLFIRESASFFLGVAAGYTIQQEAGTVKTIFVSSLLLIASNVLFYSPKNQANPLETFAMLRNFGLFAGITAGIVHDAYLVARTNPSPS